MLEDLKRDVLEEQEKRTKAERAAARATARVADLRTALASNGRSADAVQQLRAEAARLRELANNELPKCATSLGWLTPGPASLVLRTCGHYDSSTCGVLARQVAKGPGPGANSSSLVARLHIWSRSFW